MFLTKYKSMITLRHLLTFIISFWREHNMKKFFHIRYILAFGLLLIFQLFVATSMTAQAADIGNSSKEIQLNVTKKSLVVDTTYELKLYNLLDSHRVSYRSDASSIASVNKNGEITGNKVGTATISVTVRDGFKIIANLDCEVTVGPPAVSIRLTKLEITLSLGKRTSLKGILKPDNTVENIKFESEDREIATISSTGTIIARSVGETTIRAYIDNGKEDFCKIIVTE